MRITAERIRQAALISGNPSSRRQAPRSPNAGWLLVGLIVLLTSLFVAIGGISLAVGQSRQTVSYLINQLRAASLAQAGVMRAIYDVRNLTGMVIAETSIDAGNPSSDVYTIGCPTCATPGPQADFLLVNWREGSAGVTTTGGLCSGSRDNLRGWSVTNVLAAGMPLTITGMTVEWDNPGAERLIGLTLNSATVWSDCAVGGGFASGTPVVIPNRTINPRVLWSGANVNRLWWSTNGTMANKQWIKVSFTMADNPASVRTTWFDVVNPANRSADFTIRAFGEVRSGAFPFTMWQRVKAEYRLSSGGTTVSTSWAARSSVTGQVLSAQALETKTP